MEEKRQGGCVIPDSPCMNATRMLMRIMRRHHACIERQISDMGVHHSQHRTLMELIKRQDQALSQRELAAIMGVSPAAVTTILKKLEKEGYVSRSATDEDNRKNEIRITERGRSAVMESRAVFENTDRAMFAGFSDDELSTLLSFMERIDRNLDDAGVPPDPPPPKHDRKPTHPPRTRKEV